MVVLIRVIFCGSVKVAEMTPLEFNIFFGAKLFYAFYMFVLTSIYGVHSGGIFFTLYVAGMVCHDDPAHLFWLNGAWKGITV